MESVLVWKADETMLRLVNPGLVLSLTWYLCGLGNLIRSNTTLVLTTSICGFISLNVYQDCDDSSDEKNCRMVSFDEEKYLKNKPPLLPLACKNSPSLLGEDLLVFDVGS